MDLPSFLRKPVVGLIGFKCYQELFINLNLSHADCLRLAFSKALGLGLVAGGALVKLPQIGKIVQARNARGLSLSSLLIETLGFCIVLAYNMREENPFSTYGETFFIFGQNLVIAALMLAFTAQKGSAVASSVGFSVFLWLLLQPSLVSEQILALLQAITIPMFLASKVPQILANYQNHSTGQLSAFTVFLTFLGSAARIFTTLQEVDDKLILLGFVLGTVFNGVLAAQMLYYWGGSSVTDKQHKEKTQ